MPFSTQLTRGSLHAQVIVLATLLILLLPVNGAEAPQEHDPREHPPKLLNYSKMTTRQLVDEGEKIISAIAIDKMVDYLAEIEEDKEPPPIK